MKNSPIRILAAGYALLAVSMIMPAHAQETAPPADEPNLEGQNLTEEEREALRAERERFRGERAALHEEFKGELGDIRTDFLEESAELRAAREALRARIDDPDDPITREEFRENLRELKREFREVNIDTRRERTDEVRDFRREHRDIIREHRDNVREIIGDSGFADIRSARAELRRGGVR